MREKSCVHRKNAILALVAQAFPNLEGINDSPETGPSMRILGIVPDLGATPSLVCSALRCPTMCLLGSTQDSEKIYRDWY